MTIRDPKKFVSGLWDWAILDGCFGETKIKVGDCEGKVERNGRVLIIETKAPHADIPYGQDMMFDHETRYGQITVFVVWGETNNPIAFKYYTRTEVSEIVPIDLEKFRTVVSRWFEWASRQKLLEDRRRRGKSV